MLKELLKNSKRPVIILGGGLKLSDLSNQVRVLIKLIKIPLLVTWKGIDLVDDKHKYYVGRFGIYGQKAANFCIQNCDLFISIGSRLSLPQIGYNPKWFAREAKKVVIDIDINELRKFEFDIDLSLNEDCGQFLIDNINLFIENNWNDWNHKCQLWKRTYPMILPEYKEQNINSYYFFDKLSNHLHADDVILPGASGTAYTSFHQSFKVKLGQNIYTSHSMAEMGFSMGAALGAYFGTNRRVITIDGDGSHQLNSSALQTFKHYNAPIKIFYLANNEYLTIKNTFDNIYDGRYVGIVESKDVSFPDIEKICHAYDIKFTDCKTNKHLDYCINTTINSNGPHLCKINMVKNQAYIPKISYRFLKDGTKIACPLEDMASFLTREELKNEMMIPLLPESLLE